jgi:hypothetical protein
MQQPTIIAEVGFGIGASSGTLLHLGDSARGLLGTGTLGDGQAYTDVTPWLRSFTTRRGSDRVSSPVVSYGAGNASLVLRDDDRRFDASNLAGPYVSGGVTQVRPMRVVRLRATWAGVTYNIWRGFADSWTTEYTKPRYAETTVAATDGFKVLGQVDRAAGAAVGAGEDSGTRVDRILNSADWPSEDRLVATGNTTVQATTLEGNALQELQLTADTELGEFYIDSGGRAFFRNRQAIFTDARSATSQATFGDNAGELKYQDVVPEYDDEQLVNVARVTRVGGTEQVAQDVASKTANLTRSFDRSDLIMQTDSVALSYANWVVSQSKDPEYRFAALSVEPLRDPDNLWPAVLSREIGDRITIIRRPPTGSAIQRDVFIRGVEHEWSASPARWRVTFTLQSATKWGGFVLGSSTLGVLGQNALAI